MIFITGDTHGPDRHGSFSRDGFMSRLNTTNFPEQKEMTKDDFVIICGDFGGIWDTDRTKVKESSSEKYSLDWLEAKPFTTLFVPGNHENYDRLTGIKDEKLLNSWLFAKMPEDEKEKFRKGYPRIPFHGFFARQIRPSVLMLEHGVFELNGKTFFAYGGAQSHDIEGGILNPADFPTEGTFESAYKDKCCGSLHFRVKGVSWWEQEQPDAQTEATALASLAEHHNTVDFIVTHDCAASDNALLGYRNPTRINEFLETIKQTVTYRHWLFGHLHDNRDLPGGKDHLLYEQIIQIG